MFQKIIFTILLFFISATITKAQADDFKTMEAKVAWIIADHKIEVMDKTQEYQKLRFEITNGSEKGKQVEIEIGLLPVAQNQTYAMGDRVVLGRSGEEYYIVDQVRRPALYLLIGLFIVVTIVVAKRRAIQALLALITSFFVIFQIVLPQILLGTNPIIVSLIAALLIIPLTFYISHGWSQKTHIAVLGTLMALIVTASLASIFTDMAKLTGFASEDATFIQVTKGSLINIKGLLLAGIIIGVLGILDDVTISQAALVYELHHANPQLAAKKLYEKAMNVGTDHIASMINTLVLVYTGAAMPLLLLFLDSPKPLTEIINYEMVAEEIIRMLVGSIGLVLAVPFTTMLAVLHINKSRK
jgi:uncharacterized membrane protein